MVFPKEWKNSTSEEGKYTFGNNDSQIVNVNDLEIGDLFFATDEDGNLIEDDDGNTLFRLDGDMDKDRCGDYLPCIPVGKV